jgi:cell division protein FtsL
MEELYNIIGKLYVDIYHAQKYIDSLQNNIKDKDSTIANLKLELKNLDVEQ